MIFEFFLPLVLITATLFGLFHISELGFLAGSSEQASFFSARSEFVGLRGDKSSHYFLAPIQDYFKVEDRPAGRSAHVSFRYPGLLPFAETTLSGSSTPGPRCSASVPIGTLPVLCGLTAIPRRGTR